MWNSNFRPRNGPGSLTHSVLTSRSNMLRLESLSSSPSLVQPTPRLPLVPIQSQLQITWLLSWNNSTWMVSMLIMRCSKLIYILIDYWTMDVLSKDFNAINAGDGRAEVTALCFLKDRLTWPSYEAMGYFFHTAASQPAPTEQLYSHPCSLVIYHHNVIQLLICPNSRRTMVWPGLSRGGDSHWIGPGFLPTDSVEAPISQSTEKSGIWSTGIMFRWALISILHWWKYWHLKLVLQSSVQPFHLTLMKSSFLQRVPQNILTVTVYYSLPLMYGRNLPYSRLLPAALIFPNSSLESQPLVVTLLMDS